ncbi:hypothetical protein HanPSC8_Chr13g0551981 [Helianthus annuus]|nr:hypothetical protein HanPSC8_Chr13g0551981 [Helianthus annuus]
MMSEKPDYEKYFVPQAVSIGPYHFGELKLQMLEKRKPEFAMKLFSNDKEALTSLYEKLGDPEMVKDLRSFYEEGSTTKYCDKVFTKMMLLDACFILYLINSVFDRNIRSTFPLHMVPILCIDLFLLENQIPFKVLSPKRTWLESILCIRSDQRSGEQRQKSELIGGKEPDHLLHLLHRSHTTRNIYIDPFGDLNQNYIYKSNNFPNVNQLLDVGIRFKPSDHTISLEHFDFSKGWCGFSIAVQLPPMDVTGYTKPILINLIAYEMYSGEDDWVTSYVCLLHSLIGDHEDVKVLTKAGVLENWLGTDSEVVELFREGPNYLHTQFAYLHT